MSTKTKKTIVAVLAALLVAVATVLGVEVPVV